MNISKLLKSNYDIDYSDYLKKELRKILPLDSLKYTRDFR